MAILDERGRLFGKINLIDLLLIVLVVVAVPVGYAAYLLFRTPTPRITTFEPNRVVLTPGAPMRVAIRGVNLRPFLKASLDNQPVRSFLVETPQEGEIVLTDPEPGTHDVVLFDEAHEIARFPKAITVVPPPPPPPPPVFTLQALGGFVGTAATLADLQPGDRLGSPDHPAAEVLDLTEAQPDLRRVQIGNAPAVFAPVAGTLRRRATLRVNCDLATADSCTVGGAPLAAGGVMHLPVRGQMRAFAVDEVRGDSDMVAEVKVRFVSMGDAVRLMKTGDVDRASGAGPERGAILTSADEPQTIGGNLTMSGAFNLADASMYLNGEVREGLQSRIVNVRVPLEPGPTSWRYRGLAIRAGVMMMFETTTYSVRGMILSMSTPVSGRGPKG